MTRSQQQRFKGYISLDGWFAYDLHPKWFVPHKSNQRYNLLSRMYSARYVNTICL